MKKKIIIILVSITILLSSILLYSRYIGTIFLFTNEIVLNDAELPKSFSGLKVVQFSDLHYGRIITKERVKDLVKEINANSPDIVIFTGDLIDYQSSTIKEIDTSFLIEELKNINAKYFKYAIIGNHDYNYGIDKLKTIYASSGFILLENESDIIYNELGDKIFIGGVSTFNYDQSDINKVLETLTEDITYEIILAHEPDYVDTILDKNNQIDLILSGHSHNGQVVLPIIGALFTPNGAKKYYAPHYKINNTDLYISNGIGVSRINFRLFNHPSINFFRINNE